MCGASRSSHSHESKPSLPEAASFFGPLFGPRNWAAFRPRKWGRLNFPIGIPIEIDRSCGSDGAMRPGSQGWKAALKLGPLSASTSIGNQFGRCGKRQCFWPQWLRFVTLAGPRSGTDFATVFWPGKRGRAAQALTECCVENRLQKLGRL